MHRTTTTAALLVTVAVSALTGCVTVQRHAGPGPRPDAAPAAPRPYGTATARPGQAPAREALERVGPSGRPHHPAPGSPSAAPPPAAPRPAPAPPHLPPPRPRGVPQPAVPLPDAAELCALGKKYGGWRRDSPQSLICEHTYGR